MAMLDSELRSLTEESPTATAAAAAAVDGYTALILHSLRVFTVHIPVISF